MQGGMPESFLSAFFLLLLVLDPLGNTVPFLSLTKHLTPARRRAVILRECAIGTLVLVLFAFLGKYFLAYTGVKPGTLGLTGGVMLFLIGMKMLFKGGSGMEDDEAGPGAPQHEPFLVPLALPLFAGPSSIALTVLNMAPEAAARWTWFAGMLAACAVSTVVLLFSSTLLRRLGEAGMRAMERLMGLVLTVIAVQMVLDGFRLYWSTLPR